MCDDKGDITLNSAELLPNMCDNHQGAFEQGKVEEVTSLSLNPLEIFWNVKFWPGSLD
jgi:hypothetical protein